LAIELSNINLLLQYRLTVSGNSGIKLSI